MIARWKHAISSITIAFALIWLLTSLLSTQTAVKAAPAAAQLAVPQAVSPAQPQPIPTPDTPIARPCGRGAKMQPWAVCLYGVVTDTGEAVDGAIVEATDWKGHTVSATTELTRSLERISNYGIDLSQLDVDYLDTITVTVRYNGKHVTRQILVYPDFFTQNQHHDFILPADSSEVPAEKLWGYVYVFGASRPLADVQVVAESNGKAIAVTTTRRTAVDPYPYFVFSDAELAQITPKVGTIITLTAIFSGTRRQLLVPWSGEQQQVNFMVGWECDGDGALPREGGHFGVPREGGRFGVPREGGRFGVPDEVCFWGQVIVDHRPVAGMVVQLDVDDSKYADNTLLDSMTGTSSFHIRVPNASKIDGKPITVTGIYSGYFVTSTSLAKVNTAASQMLDSVVITGVASLAYNTRTPSSIKWFKDRLWVGTTEGTLEPCVTEFLTCLEIVYISPEFITDNVTIKNLTVGSSNSLWFSTARKVFNIDTNSLFLWQTLVVSRDLDARGVDIGPVNGIDVDHRGDVWIATEHTVYQYDPISNTSRLIYELNRSATTSTILAIKSDSSGSIWIGTNNYGVVRYNPRLDPRFNSTIPLTTSPFISYTTADGLSGNVVDSIAVDHKGKVWFSTSELTTTGNKCRGLSSFSPSTSRGITGIWQNYDSTNGLVGNCTYTIAIDALGDLRVGGNGGYSSYSALSQSWRAFTLNDMQFQGGETGQLIGVESNELGQVWFLSSSFFGGILDVNYWDEPPGDVAFDLNGPLTALENEVVSYNVNVSNVGKGDLEPTIVFTNPKDSTYQSSSIPAIQFQPLTWELSRLSPGKTVSFTIQILMPNHLSTTPEIDSMQFATASVSMKGDEANYTNNTATWSIKIRDSRSNLRISLNGPPLFILGESATFTVWIDNISGSSTTIQDLRITVPEGFSPPDLGLNGVPIAFGEVISRQFTLNSPSTLPAGSYLSFSAEVTANEEEVTTEDNKAIALIPTDAANIDTLFLIAGERMAQRSGQGASQVVNTLYDLANKQLANGRQMHGAVVDVQMASPAVAAAYVAWAKEPFSATVANQVVQAIKDLLIEYAQLYPKADSFVFVGGDDIIPFYRQVDESSVYWPEKRYLQSSTSRSNNTVRNAINENYFLTDDFYTDFAPQSPDSIFWKDAKRHFYIPKKASGRLVETPEEIVAAINSFVASAGELTLATTLAGADPVLTTDSAGLICETLNSQAANSCALKSDPILFRDLMTSTTNNMTFINAQHSNHRSMGEVNAPLVHDQLTNLQGRLLLSIGCHSGLNVPSSPNNRPLAEDTDYDLMQAVLGKGGVAIAPTAYAYATFFKQPSYSEALLMQFISQTQNSGEETIGNLLMQTKAQFYTHQQQFLDAIDEKSAAAMTLYGLPMWTIKGGSAQNGVSSAAAMVQTPTEIVQGDAVSYSVQTISFTVGNAFDAWIHTTDGDYYTYQDQIFVSDLRPVQPRHTIVISPYLPSGAIPHGVILRQAIYREIKNFNPVIALAQAIGEAEGTPVEPKWEQHGWDWSEPYFLSNFDGKPEDNPASPSLASINLVLGAFISNTEISMTERLYTNFVFDILYSNSPDKTPPTIVMSEVVNFTNATVLTVTASDGGDPPASVVAICQDEASALQTTVSLQQDHGNWTGVCPQRSDTVLIQVVDNAGNVLTTPAVQPKSKLIPLTFSIYLPMVMHNYNAPRPDLVVTKLSATPTMLAVTFRNVGEAPVTNDFWIEACVDPAPIPSQVNQICKGLSYQYAMWGYLASADPILPGEVRSVFVQLAGDHSPSYTSTLSVFDKSLPLGTTVYAHVDAANRDSCYGGVLEPFEVTQRPPNCPAVRYNNILSGTVVASIPAIDLHAGQADAPLSEGEKSSLPPLPEHRLGDENGANETQNEVRVWLPVVTK